jgi:CheY-like chemotaxis protein
VVEDEAMVAMLIEDLLTELGCVVAGVATTADEAMDMVRSLEVDFALLDINLGEGETSFDVAAALGERRTPFAWLTGYGVRGVPPGFVTAPVLDKPIDPDLFAEVVRKWDFSGNGRSRSG